MKFETFDPSIAEMIVASHANVGGLPAYLGVQLDELGPGTLRASLAVRDDLVTPVGAMHGGVMAALVDHVLGVVLYPLMERGQWAATTEFKLNYLAAVKKGRLEARSQVLSFGRRSAVVRCEVSNEGRVVCAAQGTLLISEPPASS